MKISNFLINFVRYSSTTMTDVFLILCLYFILNLFNNQASIKMCGMLYSLFTLFLGAGFDFCEPVNTLCAPFLAKQNKLLYNLKVWKVLVLNLLFYFTGACVLLIVTLLASSAKIPQILKTALNLCFKFVMFPGVTFAINNFLRGFF